jgi:VanZ family protein
MRFAAIAWTIVVVSIVILADTQRLGPVLDVIAIVPAGDKIAHFFLMGGLAATVSLALGWSGNREPARSVMLGSGGVLAVVALEELSQRWIAWRNFDLVDFVADVLGIMLGAALAFTVLSRR